MKFLYDLLFRLQTDKRDEQWGFDMKDFRDRISEEKERVKAEAQELDQMEMHADACESEGEGETDGEGEE